MYIADCPFDNKSIANTTLEEKHILYKDNEFKDLGKRKIKFELEDRNEKTLYIKLLPDVSNESVGLTLTEDPLILTKEG